MENSTPQEKEIKYLKWQVKKLNKLLKGYKKLTARQSALVDELISR